jgi:hypothetical protein
LLVKQENSMNAFRHMLAATSLTLICCGSALASNKASGSVTMGSAKAAITHAWMVRGRDEMDPERTILRIYLANADIGAKITTCKSLSCADAALEEGAMVDFSDASHLAYAVRLKGGAVQYSGATTTDAFTLKTNARDHLAGSVAIDDSGRGGARVDAAFDLELSNHFDDTP